MHGRKFHVVFDEDGDLKKLDLKNEDSLNELFQAQKIEGNRDEAH